MSIIIDSGNIFHFELSDKHGHSHYYEIWSTSFQSAVTLARKWFFESYNNEATHLERNVTGFPISKNV